jgi:hypothetical protein
MRFIWPSVLFLAILQMRIQATMQAALFLSELTYRSISPPTP